MKLPTVRQIEKRMDHFWASEAYRTAPHGHHDRLRKGMEDATLELLRADVEARDTRKPPMEMRV